MTKPKPGARRGRAPLTAGATPGARAWQSTVRLPAAAGQSVEARAALAGMTVAAWLRKTVLQALKGK